GAMMPLTLAAVVWTVAPQASVAGPPLFDTFRAFDATDFRINSYPQSGAVADFNGDGLDDVAVVRWWNAPKLDVLISDGQGGYAPPVEYPADCSYHVEAGDFDGDGWDDIVVSDHGMHGASTSVSFYFNDGTGALGARQIKQIGPGPRGMAVSDLDGDGDLDLAVCLNGGYITAETEVSILLNEGGRTFSGPFRYPAADPNSTVGVEVPFRVRAGDMDGDGTNDLVITTSSGPLLSVLFNAGDGSFAFPVTYNVTGLGEGKGGVQLSDVDHDGLLDVVYSDPALFASLDVGGFAIMKGLGGGALGSPATYPLTSFTLGTSIFTVGDVTGDGWDDVFVSYGGQSGIALAQNDGSGGFLPAIRYPAANPSDIRLGDVDGDSDLDAIVTNQSACVSVHLNRGGGDFSIPPVHPAGYLGNRNMDAGDIDGDGDDDIVVIGGLGGYGGWIEVVRNNGDGTLAPPVTYPTGQVGRRVRLVDLNGDKSLDLVWADDPDAPPYNFKTMLNDNQGNFGTVNDWAVGTGGTWDLAALDIDNDNDVDILLAELLYGGNFEKFVYIRKNNHDGTFAAPYLVEGDGTGIRGITGADFDGNGTLDLALTTALGIDILRGNGNGTYQPAELITGVPEGLDNIRAADLDGDGVFDLAAQGGSGGPLRVLLGRGDGTFEPAREYGTQALQGGMGIDVQDMDDDGDLDIAIAHYDPGQVSVFLNDGSGTFGPQNRYGAHGTGIDVRARDYDGDGFVDLAVLTSVSHIPADGYGVQILPGTGLIPAAAPIVSSPGSGKGSSVWLGTAVPNPFHASSAVSFSLETVGDVEISVVDAVGRLVRTLAHERMDPGPHVISWDGNDDGRNPLPSGVYFVRVAVGGESGAASVVKLQR
ncbi:MAG: VCBS repeat-containing protein, partial [Candidatus Eisenbacteria bacterium]|nr:VCBS repeat-containing protein [Candidatus Eisenbacteria bacterium]